MPIRIRCKHCQSRIDARDDLLGQTRNCPKCRQSILIEPEKPTQETISSAITGSTAGTGLSVSAPVTGELLPIKLHFAYKYFILSSERLLAYWDKTQGWMFNVGTGFSQARRNLQAIPDQGTFALLELQLVERSQGQAIAGLKMYHISQRGALTALARLEDEILGRIDGPASLNKQQKISFLSYLRQHYMGDFLSNAKSLVEFLTNNDLTSTQIRESLES